MNNQQPTFEFRETVKPPLIPIGHKVMFSDGSMLVLEFRSIAQPCWVIFYEKNYGPSPSTFNPNQMFQPGCFPGMSFPLVPPPQPHIQGWQTPVQNSYVQKPELDSVEFFGEKDYKTALEVFLFRSASGAPERATTTGLKQPPQAQRSDEPFN